MQNKIRRKRKMQNKKTLIALILVVILTTPMMMQLGQVFAQSTVNVPDYLYVNASPNPVGVGQTVYVSLFFSKPIPIVNSTSFFLAATQYIGLKINIVKPDGSNETLGPYTSDTTGGVGAVEFVPATVGNYTFQGIFPGQSLGTDPTGTTYNMDPAVSPPVKLVVQQSPVSGYSSAPLPSSYWTRPLYASNYGWPQTIGGNWYGLGRPGFDNTGGYDGSGNNFQPYSTAPTTAHVLWTKLTTTGGQPGGETPANEMSAYTASSPLYHFFEPIILNGILYYNWYAAQTDVAGIAAVNLRTGQTLWVQNTTDILIYGQVITYHTVEEFGSQAFLWTSHLAGYAGMGMFGPNAIYEYNILDPVTGNQMATVTDIPSNIASLFGTSTNALIDSNESNCAGSILIYYVDYSNNLVMWNSSLCLTGPGASGPLAEIFTGDFKPTGSYNFTQGIEWSVPLPTANPAFGIAKETNQAILLSSHPAVLSTFANQFGASYATDVAYNPITGALLWGPRNQTLTNFDDIGIVAAGDGVYVRHDKDTNQVYGYSMTTGQQLWGPTQLVGNALSTIYSDAAIAYGRCYIWDMGGYANAVDLTTGKLDWTYTRGSAGYNTPYGIYPNWVFGVGTLADGMLFLSEGRCYDPPLFPGGEKLAINCTDGSLVWEISGAFQRSPSPVADSEMLGWNGYDGQIYAFGTGPTKTTVTAPDVGVTTATPVTITGTVTDISAGASQEAVAANFPNGLPCVSDASMTPFMEAVYEQQPMPTNDTGIPVTVAVTDSNGNCYDIGTVTTSPTGTFGLTWTPIIPGNFTVTATFAGTQSYYGSFATTYFYANAAAPTAAPTATPQSNLATTADLMTYMVAVAIAIIIAIAIVGILILRKHP
jgi:outer membrane protein assembly factor BamB